MSTVAKALDRYRVTSGKGFRLRDHDPGEVADGLVEERDAAAMLADGVRRLSDLQTLLYAHGSWGLLCVFQAMDAAGKDGTIKHVMSGVNPQGVRVASFKAPGPEELAHDFLWRIHAHVPARGEIGIFNRSHYEEVLAVRVHPALLEKQKLPDGLAGKKVWQHRLDDIGHFERYLDRQGILVLKFFLNVSRAEQKRRFLDRLDHPDKNWKFSAGDIAERGFWDDYMAAYEETITETASEHAPWFVVPADHKWFTHVVVMEAMIARLEALHLGPVRMSAEQRAGLDEARRRLEAEDDGAG